MSAPAQMSARSRTRFLVTLTDGSASDTDVGAGANEATAGFRFNADGTVDKEEGGVYSQIASLTDWIIPNAANKIGFFIRATQISLVENETISVLFTVLDGTMNTWQSVGNGVAREWTLHTHSNPTGAGDATWIVDIEIASDSGGTDILEIARFTAMGTVT